MYTSFNCIISLLKIYPAEIIYESSLQQCNTEKLQRALNVYQWEVS